MISARRLALVLLGWAAVSPSFAFDPSLVDLLLDGDATVRKSAYERAAVLSEPDQINLAPFISDRLDDPVVGERAAMALCRLGEIGVPYLDRHARSSIPGAEFAAMGLLAGQESGPAALAGILRNGDEKAVMRVLAVIQSSTVMPPVVAAEVEILANDTDSHFSKVARSTLDAVAKARAERLGAKDSADLKSELARLSSAEAPSGSKASGEESLKTLVADLQSKGAAGEQALSDAFASGAIDKATYDQIKAMLDAAPTVETSSSASSGQMKTWQPDTSGYKTRQPAADAFNKNH